MNDMLQSLMSAPDGGPPTEWLRPLAYGLAALVFAWLGSSQSMALRTPNRTHSLWVRVSALYLLIAASCLVQSEVLWVHWARDFAREQQVYGDRRWFQLLALLALALLAWVTWQRYGRVQRQTASRRSVLRNMLLTGIGITLGLYVLRHVSFHYTDLALNALLLGHSLGTWLELVSLGLAGLATGLEILRSYGHV